jgi:hypothetical protein
VNPAINGWAIVKIAPLKFPEKQACQRHAKFVLFSRITRRQPGGFLGFEGFC